MNPGVGELGPRSPNAGVLQVPDRAMVVGRVVRGFRRQKKRSGATKRRSVFLRLSSVAGP